MNKSLSLVVLIVGIILLIYGVNAGGSLASNVKESVTGTPTDKSLWLLIGGIVGMLVGGFGVLRSGKA